ncbi:MULTISPECIES: helix-turn-helix domain-containing protein [unclassified Methylobacterium]|jgi:DNA-binding transcriptional MerR regulator|uniref:MerR family transcriptional regulator n=1 Tax=unclassified Methylobacterium TaxID=2615210 RepID=UPI0006F2CAA7|nr:MULTISPECIES: helix-turn-helix domain-containing protein [unclassified Methylobacterium]KQP15502.1 MerR family transcriptional regulator [Methylobacterium sp. Leaf93]TXN38923.1 helix-turn-helix domain-containing protein [Methylobacterium sp. WL93]TXN47599.1 helix-turn-helix domain-containing protein [Methylobacterium sp. WL119]TXN67723.1 helix-turn-helix domain-containing protein [Methylobacterium sp. WL30]
MTIGDLAAATNTRVETIRWYEKVKLLPATERSAGNYRLYGPEHLRRLSFIRRGRDLGFTVDQIRELLAMADDRDRSCAEVDTIARAHLAQVERKLADLTRLAHELRDVIGQCGCGSVADCRIIEALSPHGDPS